MQMQLLWLAKAALGGTMGGGLKQHALAGTPHLAQGAAKQERELADLLVRFASDLGDTQHFSIRLHDELAALEVGCLRPI